MSTILVCFTCRKKYNIAQPPQGRVSCKLCGKPLKVVPTKDLTASQQELPTTAIEQTTKKEQSRDNQVKLNPLPDLELPSHTKNDNLENRVLSAMEENSTASLKKPIETKTKSPRKPSSSVISKQSTIAARSNKTDSHPSGFHKLETIEELEPQRREDLHFALRLLTTERVSPSILTNAMEEVKEERKKGNSINFGQFLMRQRLIEVTDFVQLMKEISTIGIEKCDIPEGYNIFLSQDQILIQDKKMPTKVGDYQILQELGRGGMGIVYRVYHEVLAKEFALKMLLLGDRSSEVMVRRFFNEAKAIAKLSHPNIISIHHIGDEDGNPYYTMEFIPGKSLADLIREQKIPMRRAVQIAQKLASALHYAHTEKIIHRDVKPQNILMQEEKEPVLTDFGLAKDKSVEETQLTQTGTALGTPAYMSPEQARGEIRKIGPLSDIYSLGAVLYEMITGFPPFRAKNQAEMLQRVINDEVVPPRLLNHLIPRDVENICLKALEKETNKRYASGEEFQADLAHYLNGEPIKARPITPLNRLLRKAKKHKAISLTLCTTFLFLVAFSFIYYTLPGDLKIQTSPQDAQIYLDGTPYSEKVIKKLSPGIHQLTVEKEGYQKLETVVIVGRGTLSGYQFNLYSLAGNLIISSNPQGCQVDILSTEKKLIQQVKSTPSIAYLKAGKYRLRCFKPGYATQEFFAEVAGGNQNTSVNLVLPENKGQLTMLCQPKNIGAVLEIKSISTPEEKTQRLSLPLLQPLSLSDGTYELLLQQPNFVSQKLNLAVTPGQQIQLHAYLEPRVLLEYSFPDALVTTPAVYDVNQDGYPDFIVPCEDRYVYLLDGKKRHILWSWKVYNSVYSTPILFRSENSKELLVAFDSLDGYVYLLNAKTGKLKWKKKIGPARGRLYFHEYKTKKYGILCGTETGQLYCLAIEDGKEIWKYNSGATSLGFGFVLKNISGDSQKELLMMKDSDSPIFQMDPNTGTRLKLFTIPGVKGKLPTVFFDFDGDKSLDFFISATTNNKENSIIWSPKLKRTIGSIPTQGSAKVKKLHKNGKHYIIQTTFRPRSLFIYQAKPPFSLVHKEFIGDVISTGPVFEDVNRDGYLDIIFESEDDITYVCSGKDFSRLFDFYTSGMNWSKFALKDVSKGWKFRFRTGETKPVIADINKDGSRDIVVASENNTLYGVTAKENEILTLIPFKQETVKAEYVDLKTGGILFLNTGFSGAIHGISGLDGRLLFKFEGNNGIKRFNVHHPAQGDPKQILIHDVKDQLSLFSLPDFKELEPLHSRSKETPFLMDLDEDETPDWLMLANSKTQIIAQSGSSKKVLFRTEFPREINFRFAKLLKTQRGSELFVHDVKGEVYVVSAATGKILRQYFSFDVNYQIEHHLADLNDDQIPELISVKHPMQLKVIDGRTKKTKILAGKNISHALAPITYRGSNGIIAMMASINVPPTAELYDFNQDEILDICFLNERNRIDILNSDNGKIMKSIQTPKPISSNIQLADFDQDGIKDILIGCLDQLCIFSGSTGKQIWQYNFAGRIDFISQALDMNRDGRLDFWIATRNQRCYQISPRISQKNQ